MYPVPSAKEGHLSSTLFSEVYMKRQERSRACYLVAGVGLQRGYMVSIEGGPAGGGPACEAGGTLYVGEHSPTTQSSCIL